MLAAAKEEIVSVSSAPRVRFSLVAGGDVSTAVGAAVALLPFLYFRGLFDKINALDSYHETEAECRAAYE